MHDTGPLLDERIGPARQRAVVPLPVIHLLGSLRPEPADRTWTGAAPARVLVWQWGRFGGAPRFASQLAEGFAALPGVEVSLSLSRGAEIMRGAAAPKCDLPIDTYASVAGLVRRLATAPFAVPGLARRVRALRPDIAICAQPGPMDMVMATVLRRLQIPFVVLVHDADAHPGDGFPLQMWLQRKLCGQATAIASLSGHVADRLLDQKLAGTPSRPLIRLRHPPVRYAFTPRDEPAAGTFRLLSFGRLLPYKGLDLLADSLRLLGARPELTVRVVGSGPESRELDDLRHLPGVTVENRWVPETEVGALFSWADAVILSYREASQSGVAAVALAAHCPIVATRVGGLPEQLRDEPLAILCEPDAAGLANGLRRVLDQGPMQAPVPAATNGWSEIAGSLLDQMDALRLALTAPGSSATAVRPSP